MIGTPIGQYRIVRVIGEGGMGIVYEAVHDGLGQRAAVKVLRPELQARPELLRRFLNEARAAALVQHPGLVRIFDLGRLPDGNAYILMEYLEGESLRERLRRTGGRLPLLEALRLSRQLASALAAAHARGVVHRDVKPDNVLIVADAEAEGGERARLLDFGIARLPEAQRGDEAGVLTRPGMLLGSPRYMAPEQCGGGAVDDRADVYSLGVVLHEAASGLPPFRASRSDELILKHISEPPPPLRSLDPALPAPLETLVLAMLAKEPAERPAVAEVARRLGALARDLVPEDGGAEDPARAETGPTMLAEGAAPRRGLPQPSRLEQLVEEELGRTPAPPLRTADGPVPQLSPKRFQDIMTAFLLHDGERYCLDGKVLRQRGVSLAEAHALTTDCGVGARFLVEPAAAASAESFFVTVYTVLPAHTRLLQERLQQRAPVTLVVRVLAARPETSPGAPPAGFAGFALFGSATSHPWTLVVDEALRPEGG